MWGTADTNTFRSMADIQELELSMVGSLRGSLVGGGAICAWVLEYGQHRYGDGAPEGHCGGPVSQLSNEDYHGRVAHSAKH